MALKNEMKIHKNRTLKTLGLSLVFLSLGLFSATVGPSILDLQIAANTTLGKITQILPSRSGGYAIGSILASIIIDRLDHQLILLFSVLSSAGTFAFIPFTRSVEQMYSTMFLHGLSTGVINTCGNVWVIHLWGKENPPFLQIIHFSYGVGTFMSPFIVEPFLLPIQKEISLNLNHSIQINHTLNLNNLNLATNQNQAKNSSVNFLVSSPKINSVLIKNQYTYKDLKVQWAFIIVTVFVLFVFVFLLGLYLNKPSNKAHPSRLKVKISLKQESKRFETVRGLNPSDSIKILNRNTLDKHCEPKLQETSSSVKKTFFIILFVLYMHFYCGIEISFGTFLPTFAVKSNLHLSKTLSSYLTSTYWGTFTFFRLITLIAINYLKPKTLIIINLVLIALSNAILIPFGNQNVWLLWTGVTLMGFGCSSMFGLVFSYLEEIISITSKITSCFMISACMGEFTIPYLVGLYIEQDPFVYLIIIFIYSLISFLLIFMIFCSEFLFFRSKISRKVKNQQSNKIMQKMNENNSLQTISKEFNSLNVA